MAARARARGILYLDSSALVKTVVAEPESAALRRLLRRHHLRVSCARARRRPAGDGAVAVVEARRTPAPPPPSSRAPTNRGRGCRAHEHGPPFSARDPAPARAAWWRAS